MTLYLSDDTKVILLLCGVFGDRTVKPLSPGEYNAVARWLVGVKKRPRDLLSPEVAVNASRGSEIDELRLEALLRRGVALGFAVEQWERNGIWIVSRGDADYPSRYKKHLKEKAPPILFGAGDRSMLEGGGLAIIGSRNVDEDGREFTRQTATLCANQGISVVSGGARGVDGIAMESALNAGGAVIGVLADNLLKKSLEKAFRGAIASGKLLLLSPYHPEASFSVGSAMGRNKLIYALSDYALVVSSDYKKGGTWAGAEEELKRGRPLPVFVRLGDRIPEGNKRLAALGALPWPNIGQDGLLLELLAGKSTEPSRSEQSFQTSSLFDENGEPGSLAQVQLPETEETPKKHSDASSENTPEDSSSRVAATLFQEGETAASLPPADVLYRAVLPLLLEKLEKPASADELASLFDVSKPQIRKWLDRGTAEGKVKKTTRPVRYCTKETDSEGA